MASSGAGISPPPPPLPLRASYVNGYLASHAKKLENGNVEAWQHDHHHEHLDHHHHLYRVETMPHPHTTSEPTLGMTQFAQGHNHYHMGPSAGSPLEKHLVGAHFARQGGEGQPQSHSQYSYGPPPPLSTATAPDTDQPHLQQQPTPNFIGANEPQLKKSSLKKRSRFDHLTFGAVGEAIKSEEHNHATGGLMGPNSSMLGLQKRCSTAKHVELLNFTLKGGPPWGFRIKQRNGNVFISKVNCGGRGHKGGLRVHDEIISVNNFELDNHPLTLHRQPDSQSKLGFELDHLTKLDFTYQLIKHTLNRQLQLTVRRWHSDWDLAPHIFYPISSGDDEGPLHQSEEELLSPNEDLGPESRNAHRKLLTISHFQQQQQQQFGILGKPTSLPTLPDAAHTLSHGFDPSGQFLIPPPANLGFGGSSVGGADSVLSESSYTSGASSSTTTTGCLIAATEAEIQKAAEEVITTCSSSLTPTTTTTENSVCPNDYDHRCSSAKFITRPEYSSSCSLAYCTAIHTNSNHHHQPQGSSGYFDDSSSTNDEYYEHHHHQRHQDQASDIAPLDLSPDGGSGSVESSLTEDQAKPPSQVTEPSEDEEMTTVLICGTSSFKTSGKSPQNIWSPCTSSSLASPSPTTSETISDLGPLGSKPSKLDPSERQLGLNYLLYSAQPPPDSYPTASGWYQSEEEAYHQSHYPPPFSSATYAGFDHHAVSDATSTASIASHSGVKPSENPFSIERAFNLGRYPPTFSESLRASSTLPRSMTIMAGRQGVSSQEQPHHVAEVYEPKQHPVHKYWTLPRGIATGTGVATFVTPDMAEDEIDRFHQQLQEARMQEFAEQHMKNGDSVTEATTTTVTKTAPEDATTVTKQIVQQVLTDQAPPPGATLLYETEDATFYTVPLAQTSGETESGKQISTTTTYAVPKKKIDESVNESGGPLTLNTTAKQEHNSDWYKTWVRNMHKMERSASTTAAEDPANSISIKVKSPRYKGTDYHLSLDNRKAKYVPGNIADYEPGIHSSIFEHERQLFYNDIFNYIDSIFAEVLASTAVSANQKFQSQLRKRAQSLSRMSSMPAPNVSPPLAPGVRRRHLATSSSSVHSGLAGLEGDYAMIYPSSSRSLPSLRASSFLEETLLPMKQQLLHSFLRSARRLSMPGKIPAAMTSGGKKLRRGTKKSNQKGVKRKPSKKKLRYQDEEITSSEANTGDQKKAPSDEEKNRGLRAKGKNFEEKGEENDEVDGADSDDDEEDELPDGDDDDHYGDDEVSSAFEDDLEENDHHESSQQPTKQSSSQTAAKSSYYHENCVFNTLTGSVSGGSGYDSDSSYIIKKATKQVTPKPASPSVYRAVQRGEMDIPLCGLQRPAPPRPNRTQQKLDSKLSSFEYAEDSGISVRQNDPDWDSLDEWQNQIENDFDYIYDTLRNVSTSSSSTLRSGTHALNFSRASSTPKASTPFPRRGKKSVAFEDEDEVQVIEVDEDVDEPTLTNGNLEDEVDEVEEEEYSYAGLLRPGSHKPTGTARSFEHFLNTQDLNKSVQRLKSPEDKLRVRRHRRRSRSKSPVTNRTRSEERGSDLTRTYDELDTALPTYFESKSLSPVRMTTTATVVGQPESKINVQYRLPTNPQLSDTNGDTSTSTATVMSSGRFYGGSYRSSSQPQTPVSMKPIAKVTKMPCSEQTDRFSMQRHHYVPTPMSPVALDRYDRAFANKENEPKKVARVLYDFQAMGRNELAVKKNDLVLVRRNVNHNWVEVEDCSSGLVGFVPRTYLDYEQNGVARAKFDFQAKTSVEISFKKGEKLTLLRRVDNNWYEGINERQDVGIFPVSYVEPVKQPIVLKSTVESSSTDSRMSQSPAPSGSTTRSYLLHPLADGSTSMLGTPPPSAGSSTGSVSLGPMASMPQLPTSSTPIQPLSTIHLSTGLRGPTSTDSLGNVIYFSSTNSEPAGGYSSSAHQIRRAPDASRQPGASVERFCLPKPRIFRVLYPYKPQQMDELELQYGDLLTVTIQCDDGWFLGRSTLTGKFGTFPGNYVEPV